MYTIRAASLCVAVAMTLVAVPVHAQGQTPGATSSLVDRLAALEARVAKLEGSITALDLVGTYRVAGFITDLDASPNPASATIIALSATVTLAADGTGTVRQQGGAIDLVQGSPWTSGSFTFPPEDIDITWSYANGTVRVTDGTPDLDTTFDVGAGGRVLIFSGLSDDITADLIIATRLR